MNRTFSTTFLRLFVGLTVNLFVLEKTLFAGIAIPILICNFDIGEDANNHMTDSFVDFEISFLMDCCLWVHFLSNVFFRHFVSAMSEQERAVVLSFHACCRRGGNCKHLLLNTVLLLSTGSNPPGFLSR